LFISSASIVDTHCHLDYIQQAQEENEDPDRTLSLVLERAHECNLSFLVNPSVSLDNIPTVVKLAESRERVYAAVAIHPTEVRDTLAQPNWKAFIEGFLTHPKVVAIGETGLDYYHDQSFNTLQQECFKTFLELGVKYKLPVIVHDREAHKDVLALIDSVPGSFGVMHCFSGDADLALQMIQRGFYISFAGNVTYKKATNLHEAAKVIPLERMLVETDAPFLSPVPFRGKPNEPARVVHVIQMIADLRGEFYGNIAEQTSKNAHHLFNIPV
jgi:TatD DNase family protein